MIDPEEFAYLARTVTNGRDLLNADALALVEAVLESEARLDALEDTYNTVFSRAREMIAGAVEATLATRGEPDSEESVAAIVNMFTARFELAVGKRRSEADVAAYMALYPDAVIVDESYPHPGT